MNSYNYNFDLTVMNIYYVFNHFIFFSKKEVEMQALCIIKMHAAFTINLFNI